MSVDDFVENMNSAGDDFGAKINKAKDGNDQGIFEVMEEVGIKDVVEEDSIVNDAEKDTTYYLSEEEFNDQRTLNRLREANDLVSRADQVEEVG